MFILGYIVVAIAAYLLGSIPTGFLVGRVRGIDIRAVGSGNIGAANTFRTIGKTAGIFVLLMDALKGFVAVESCGLILKCLGIAETDVEIHYRIVAGIFAVLGHNYTCWLKFKGGKGVATTAGVYVALAPAAVGIAAVIFILIVAISRYTSLGSMLAAVVLAIAVWFIEPPDMILRTVTIALCVLTLLKHRTNMQRLIAGKENRIEFKKKPPEGRNSSTL